MTVPPTTATDQIVRSPRGTGVTNRTAPVAASMPTTLPSLVPATSWSPAGTSPVHSIESSNGVSHRTLPAANARAGAAAPDETTTVSPTTTGCSANHTSGTVQRTAPVAASSARDRVGTL